MKKVIYLLFLGYFAMNANCVAKNGFDANSINVLVAGNNDFAFDLYGKLKDDSKSNLFFSPYSISTALVMVYGGAGGNTKKQMAETLHYSMIDEQLYPAFSALQKLLVQKDKSTGYQLLLANALWKQKGVPFLKAFLDLTQHYCEAGIDQLDFINETEKSRQIINTWVGGKTSDKIKSLIPPGGVSNQTVLVLTNAIYFKGDWKTKFSWWKTRKADFAVSAKDKVKVPLMHLKEKFKYYGDEKLQALEMPYKGDTMSMLILLPRQIERFPIGKHD